MYFLVLYSNYFFYLPFQTWEAQTVTPQHLLNATITLWSQTYILGFKMSIIPQKLQIVICCGIMICVGVFLSLFWKIFFGGGKAFCFVFNKTEEWSRVLNVNEAGIMSQDLGEKKKLYFFQTYIRFLTFKKEHHDTTQSAFFIPSGSLFFSCTGFRLFLCHPVTGNHISSWQYVPQLHVPTHKVAQTCLLY